MTITSSKQTQICIPKASELNTENFLEIRRTLSLQQTGLTALLKTKMNE